MSFEEKSAWVQGLMTVGAFGAYLAIVLERAAGREVSEISYVAPMLLTTLLGVVVAVIAIVAIAILRPSEAERTDERDRRIERFGEYVGLFGLTPAVMVALGMAMAEVDHFWIANILYGGLALCTVIASGTRILAYRWRYPLW